MTGEEKKEAVLEMINDDEALLFADGFEDAILGIIRDTLHSSVPRVVYDYDRCIEVLMERDGMTYIDAVEFFSFNVEGAIMGEQTPLYWEEEKWLQIASREH